METRRFLISAHEPRMSMLGGRWFKTTSTSTVQKYCSTVPPHDCSFHRIELALNKLNSLGLNMGHSLGLKENITKG